MGRGGHPFEKFGHNALLVSYRGRDLVYNFGTFNANSETLVTDFLEAKIQYWLSVSSLGRTLRHYAGRDRSVTVQRLRLTSKEARELARALEENARPENRAYRYHFYLDNCSTRVRDALDRVLGGMLRQKFEGQMTQLSYRDHAMRLTSDSLPLYVGIDVGQGPFVDQEIDRWQAMFIPEEVRRALRETTRTLRGKEVPLVVEEKTLVESTRPLPPEEPPVRWPWFLLTGLALGGGAFWLGRQHRRSFLVSAGLTGLLFGTLGVLLILLTFFSAHEVAWRNLSVGVVPAWLLLAPLAAAWAYKDQKRARRALFWLFAAAAASACLMVIASSVPPLRQTLSQLSFVALPLWVGMALGARPSNAPGAVTPRTDSPEREPGAPAP